MVNIQYLSTLSDISQTTAPMAIKSTEAEIVASCAAEYEIN